MGCSVVHGAPCKWCCIPTDGRSTGSDAMPGRHFGLLEMNRAAGAGNGKKGERGGHADGVYFRWAASRAAAAAGTPSVQPGGLYGRGDNDAAPERTVTGGYL